MKKSFNRFRSKLLKIVIAKTAMVGLSVGSFVFGICNALSKLGWAKTGLMLSVLIGALFAVAGATVTFFVVHMSDKRLATDLDRRFDLKEKVRTMIAFESDDGFMMELQREDTERSLSEIALKSYKPRMIWLYFIAMAIGLAVMIFSIILPAKDTTPVVEDPPFSLSGMQRAGLNELISYVEKSEMDERYKTAIASELRTLLSDLEKADKTSVMKAELAESMAYILSITYDSSSSAELLDSLWDSGDVYLKHLAKTLDTSSWNAPDWGDYAEKLTKYIAVVLGDSDLSDDSKPIPTDDERKATLVYVLETSGRKISTSIDSSGISQEDILYSVILRLASSDGNVKGFSALASHVANLNYSDARLAVQETFDGITDDVYYAISHNRINAAVGEYTMTRLSTLFLVPLPEFERPEFVKNKESIDGKDSGATEEDDENGPSDGGVGEGATFGSKDLVLDPITGNYVEYGTLINQYHALMLEKLENGSYTDEQKEMIKKYFALLYSGIDKDE